MHRLHRGGWAMYKEGRPYRDLCVLEVPNSGVNVIDEQAGQLSPVLGHLSRSAVSFPDQTACKDLPFLEHEQRHQLTGSASSPRRVSLCPVLLFGCCLKGIEGMSVRSSDLECRPTHAPALQLTSQLAPHCSTHMLIFMML